MATVEIKNNIPILLVALRKAKSKGLGEMGKTLEGMMVERIESNIPPPNAKSTIKQKGSSLALVASSDMINAIETQVRDENTVDVGIWGDLATRAVINEFGAPRAGIPERSFMRSTINNSDNREEANEKMIIALRQAIEEAKLK